MSNLFYPIGLIAGVQTERADRVAADEFEDGTTATRRLWPLAAIKRKLVIQHAPLTYAEFRWLKGFFADRSGRYDSFWFRDNVNRGGNLMVRFAKPLTDERRGAATGVAVELEEVAPIRPNPELVDIELITTNANLLIWLDANREFYVSHMGSIIQADAAWDERASYPAVWQGGPLATIANIASQWQSYGFAGSAWARSSNIAQLTGLQPACSLFVIVSNSTSATKQIVLAVGGVGAGLAMGLALSAANNYEPWIGGSEVWTGAQQSNGTANTWRSICITWASASNTASLYVNGALIGSVSNTRNYAGGPASLGSAPDGTLKTLAGNTAHAMAFQNALTLAQVKALHNLLGYQYGLAVVP